MTPPRKSSGRGHRTERGTTLSNRAGGAKGNRLFGRTPLSMTITDRKRSPSPDPRTISRRDGAQPPSNPRGF